MRVNIVLLGQNAIVREGLRRILLDEQFRVLASAESAAALDLDATAALAGNLLIVIDAKDVSAWFDDLILLRQRYPRARQVVLAETFEFAEMARCFRLGVHGYIVKKISCLPLITSLELVAQGERVMPSHLAEVLPERHAADHDDEGGASDASLSGRERDVLRYLIMGYPNKLISRHLDISEATVKVHVKAILRKLQVCNRTQAAIWAAHHGLEGHLHANGAEPPVVTSARRMAPPELA